MLYTSLEEIKSFNPCANGWRGILKLQGVTANEQFEVIRCFETNSIADVLWLLGKQKKAALCAEFARWCADSVSHLRGSKYAAESAYAAYADVADADAAAYAAADAAAAAYAADVADAAYAVAAYTAADAYAAYATYTAAYTAARITAKNDQKTKLIELITTAE